MTKEPKGRIARISKRTVDAAEPSEARYILWDSELKGFGLRVEPSGSKTFIFRYRVGGGRRGTLKQFTIGAYGTFTAEEARKEAKAASGEKDPQGARVAARKNLTVSELCDLYLEEGNGHKKASTNALDRIRIERHIKPSLGKRKITELSVGDVESFVRDIAAGKLKDATAHSRGGPGAAARTAGLLSGMFKFAVKRELCAKNPVSGATRPRDQKRDRFLSPKELGDLGETLTAAAGKGAHPYHVTIIRLLCLTGARKSEIAQLKWEEVDFERGRLNLADSKTGKKSIPLGAAAKALLVAVEQTKSSFVFPDPRDPKQAIRNLDWFWVGIRNAAGMTDVRIHDLRHSFASVGVAGGASLFLLGKILGHSDIATTQRYAHLADDPVRAAADRISESIEAAMGGHGAEVLNIGAQR